MRRWPIGTSAIPLFIEASPTAGQPFVTSHLLAYVSRIERARLCCFHRRWYNNQYKTDEANRFTLKYKWIVAVAKAIHQRHQVRSSSPALLIRPMFTPLSVVASFLSPLIISSRVTQPYQRLLSVSISNYIDRNRLLSLAVLDYFGNMSTAEGCDIAEAFLFSSFAEHPWAHSSGLEWDAIAADECAANERNGCLVHRVASVDRVLAEFSMGKHKSTHSNNEEHYRWYNFIRVRPSMFLSYFHLIFYLDKKKTYLFPHFRTVA